MTDIRAMIANPEKDADIYWRTGFLAPDPLIYVETGNSGTLIVSDLELGRARETARVDSVVAMAPYREKLRESLIGVPTLADILHAYLQDAGAAEAPLTMPGATPARLVDRLRALGHPVALGDSPFWAERRHKTAWEIEQMAEAMRQTERVLDMARSMIRGASVRDGVLYTDGEMLTSERVRGFIQIELLKAGYAGAPPIVSCGDQATLPHEHGHGPLRTGETIILDVFPLSQQTRYGADTTRTVVHGVPSAEVVKMHRAVADAVTAVLTHMKAGVDGRDLHQRVLDIFESRGFRTETVDGKPQGFIHGTGHGLGLDIHETPRISKESQILEEGDVVTVEPGLYYPGIGGVRIEDVAVVTAGGYRNLCSLNWDL
ncbi:MAG: Xaa-Pro peptidase family protein [Candidatus Eisenbacteria bacterium]|nr:Xaa-Pro peptidase family protein [Candidatus Eisenbacteria bacterium]